MDTSQTVTPQTVTSKQLNIEVEGLGVVSAQLEEPADPRALLVLAHGAGAGRDHRLMEWSAQLALDLQLAVLRYNFLYMENRQPGQKGMSRPDRPPKLHPVVRAAVSTAQHLKPDLPLFAGGRSMGGRMTSQVQAAAPLPGVRGILFFAFPLHPSQKPSVTRAEHLSQVDVPMLFLNGTRDTLADPVLLREVCDGLPDHATLVAIEGADHSFAVLKRSGRTAEEVRAEISHATQGWLDQVLAPTTSP